MIIDLDNVDAVLRLYAADIDLEETRPKPLPPGNQAFRGEVTRLLLAALRQSDRPLTTKDLALSTSWPNMGSILPISG
ncbi:MAG: hypothetical protein IH900_04455 [Proteobacteria bacterium]|nr:hypothetical protein [Pseudomonadota bacterium]